MPHGDHEVRPGEHHDLAGAHHLARGRQLLVLHVADRLEHGEERLPVPLHLGPLVRLDRVLDRQRMQLEELRDARELLVRRLVQTEPDEARPAPAHPGHDVDRISGLGHADTVPVGHAVHHRGAQRGTGGVAQIHPRPPAGQPCHLPQAAGPAQPRDLPQTARHGHPNLPAWVPSRCVSRALAGQFARPAERANGPVETGDSALFPPVDGPLGRPHAPSRTGPAVAEVARVPERRPHRASGTTGMIAA